MQSGSFFDTDSHPTAQPPTGTPNPVGSLHSLKPGLAGVPEQRTGIKVRLLTKPPVKTGG